MENEEERRLGGSWRVVAAESKGAEGGRERGASFFYPSRSILSDDWTITGVISLLQTFTLFLLVCYDSDEILVHRSFDTVRVYFVG